MLPDSIIVFERGWLSANNVLLVGAGPVTLVDSGYCTHSEQTLTLIRNALGSRPLDRLVNTHLHSDHCGGNAGLQTEFPQLATYIPPGHADEVSRWDDVALTYAPTGQSCPRFRFDRTLEPGSIQQFGDGEWEIHASPGHDPHSVLLFSARDGILISGDALWETGFGVVFPELEGISAFSAVGDTLDLIEALAPSVVIPGHGRIFTDIPSALSVARRRLDGFMRDPAKHGGYAAKVLLKFKLLEVQKISRDELHTWTNTASYLALLHAMYGNARSKSEWTDQLIEELSISGALKIEGEYLQNC